MQLDEDFLQYIWQFRLLTRLSLFCANGDALQILHPGMPNRHAGPDFTMARLVIGGQLWAGNVEIHLNASHWHMHHHEKDDAYDTVILHAVYEDDEPICRTDGTLIPVLLLKGLVPEEQFLRYRNLLDNRNPFPCARQIGAVPEVVVKNLLETMPRRRMEEKVAEIDHKLLHNKNDWNQTFLEVLARNFGFKVNAVPFELLAGSLHHTIIAKHRDNPLQIEALLFGQAGFLKGDFNDAYPLGLKAEYQFLQKKYHLREGDSSVWKFLRMHPQNFPPVRIAQLGGFLSSRQGVFADLVETSALQALIGVFAGVKVHPYWKDHSNFDRRSKEVPLGMGKTSVQNLIINTVCPMLYAYGKYLNRPDLQQRALTLLHELPAERNSILAAYIAVGLKIRSAADSQATLHLYSTFCVHKKCLQCSIGRTLILHPNELGTIIALFNKIV